MNLDIVKRVTKSASWSLGGTALAKLLVLCSGIFVSNILGKNGFGELGIIRSSISMFIVLASMGLGLTCSKYIAEYRDKFPYKVNKIYYVTNFFGLSLTLIMSLLVFFLSPTIAKESLNAPHLSDEIRYGSMLILFSSLNAIQNGVLAGFENFKAIAINTFIAAIFEVFLVSVGAYYFDVKGAILGTGSSFVILYLLNILSVRKSFKKKSIPIRFESLEIIDFIVIWKFSIPAALSSFLILPVIWFTKTLLIKNDGFEEMAVYDIADQWRIMILFIPDALSRIILPMLSNIQVYDNKEIDFKNVIKINLLINIGITFVIFLGVILFKERILKLYGDNYYESATLVILSFSTIFNSIAIVVGQAIASKSKMWTGLLFNLFWGIMLIYFSHIFIDQKMGSKGIALALLCSYAFHSLFQGIYLSLLLKRKNDTN